MSDYIRREDAIRWNPASKDKREYGTFNLDDAYETGYEDKIKQIEQIPAADVEEVVRCKDCKFYDESIHFCGLYKVKHPEWFYCYDGTRSE